MGGGSSGFGLDTVLLDKLAVGWAGWVVVGYCSGRHNVVVQMMVVVVKNEVVCVKGV